jgi:lipopolysaccharide export system protein LptA
MTRRLPLLAVVLALAAPGSAAAQGQQHPAAPSPTPSILQGQNKDQPIQIESATLEVRDKSKMATFSGNVQVVQGDTTMKCQTLVVFYGAEDGAGAGAGKTVASKTVASTEPAEASKPPGASNQTAMPQGAQDIRRIEAHVGVTVVTKDQNATGDLGVYDLKAKTITLTGNVVVTQGKNVLHGDRVVVDTTTGNARVESNTTAQNRVRALILPSKGANGTSTNIMSLGPSRAN